MYFLLTASDDGNPHITLFSSKENLEIWLTQNAACYKFLDNLPLVELCTDKGEAVIIEGEVVLPKKVEVVTRYTI